MMISIPTGAGIAGTDGTGGIRGTAALLVITPGAPGIRDGVTTHGIRGARAIVFILASTPLGLVSMGAASTEVAFMVAVSTVVVTPTSTAHPPGGMATPTIRWRPLTTPIMARVPTVRPGCLTLRSGR